jgi:hypothetical protein
MNVFVIATTTTDNKLQHYRGGFQSDLILSVYAIHLRKVTGAAATYGNEYGALALCTAAVSGFFS